MCLCMFVYVCLCVSEKLISIQNISVIEKNHQQ